MSGHVPSFIRKGGFVLYKGKRRKVIDYFFTNPTPVMHWIPNIDVLILVLNRNERVEFSDTIKPIKK